MNFRRIHPCDALRPFVRQYWIFEITREDIPYAQLCFPYGSHELIFYLKGNAALTYFGSTDPFIQEKGFYAGQFTRPYELKFNEPCKCIGVCFYPWVGNLLYKIPSHLFTDSMINIDCFEKNNELLMQLCAADDDDERFYIIENYLLEKLSLVEHDVISEAIARQIILCPERDELKKFISTVGLSERRLQQRFLESSGLTMSLFLRKVRFQRSILFLRNRTRDFNFTQLALQAGYYDQSHFINDFKEFAHKTPLDFANQNSELKDFFKSLMPVNDAADAVVHTV